MAYLYMAVYGIFIYLTIYQIYIWQYMVDLYMAVYGRFIYSSVWQIYLYMAVYGWFLAYLSMKVYGLPQLMDRNKKNEILVIFSCMSWRFSNTRGRTLLALRQTITCQKRVSKKTSAGWHRKNICQRKMCVPSLQVRHCVNNNRVKKVQDGSK